MPLLIMNSKKSTPKPSPIENGLVLYQNSTDSDSYSGSSILYDLTDNNNHGTLNNVGFDGQALTFNGTGYITNDSFANFISGNNVGTLSFWVKLNSDDYTVALRTTLFTVYQPPHNPETLSFANNYGATRLQ